VNSGRIVSIIGGIPSSIPDSTSSSTVDISCSYPGSIRKVVRKVWNIVLRAKLYKTHSRKFALTVLLLGTLSFVETSRFIAQKLRKYFEIFFKNLHGFLPFFKSLKTTSQNSR
jgi:hypothetical protein